MIKDLISKMAHAKKLEAEARQNLRTIGATAATRRDEASGHLRAAEDAYTKNPSPETDLDVRHATRVVGALDATRAACESAAS